MPTTIITLLDTRRVKKTNKYPIKLRVTSERVTEYYQTIFDLPQVEWDKLSASRISSDLQTIRDKLRDIESEAESAVKKLNPFSFIAFEKEFVHSNNLFRARKPKFEPLSQNNGDYDYSPFHKRFPIILEEQIKPGTISSAYVVYIKKLLREGRISTAVNYNCSYSSLKKFRGNVCLTAITPSYLTEYENWLRSQDISKTTVGIYLRPLRALFNEAIENGTLRKENNYPFGRRKYQIPTSRNIKKSLELNDIKKIYFFECNPNIESERMARDYWLFSYFANGMNPKDIACLKYKNINGEYLVYERAKTERTMRSEPKPITVFITEDMKSIIERWGNKLKASGSYIFPILAPGLTPLQQYDTLHLFVSFINDRMKQILKKLGIDKIATTYVARHTFSTVLKRSGASTEYIQESLGHADKKTTETYLGSFDKDVKKVFAQQLTSFKNEAE